MSDQDIVAADRDMIAELFTADECYRNLVTLCDRFGSRFGGTEGEKGAVEFMAGKFREYGMDSVSKEEFRYNGWIRGTVALTTTAPLEREFKCIALPYTGTTDVEAELLYVENGTPDDFELVADKVRGKVVMASSRSPAWLKRSVHRDEKIGRAVQLGAVGFIWMRADPGLLEETGAARWNMEAEIPCIAVSNEIGEAILRMSSLGRPVRIRIATRNTIKPLPSWNVVGEIRGRQRPDECIIVGAHFDGHDISVGAVDDGAGACVVMEAARALGRHKDLLDRSVRFITFALEENGLIGSHAYVQAHKQELDKMVFMLNLDGGGRAASSLGISLNRWPELVAPFKAIGKDMKLRTTVVNGFSYYSDHFPFMVQGVPTGGLVNFDAPRTGVRGFRHTAADTLDKVCSYDLQLAALMVARLVLRMATGDVFPKTRRSPDQVKALMDKEGYLEILKLERRYPY